MKIKELLIDFAKWFEDDFGKQGVEFWVDEYLKQKSINNGDKIQVEVNEICKHRHIFSCSLIKNGDSSCYVNQDKTCKFYEPKE